VSLAHAPIPAVPPAPTPIPLSILAPAHNEEANIPALVDQVGAALSPLHLPFEFIIVDDGSTDGTQAAVRALMPGRPWLRCIAMERTPPGKGNGQSAAFHAGFRASRGRLIALLDADLQNDPADLPAMLALMKSTGADMVQGDRSHARRDSAVRKFGSWVGRIFRRALLGDTIRDTGCSLRVMRREVALGLPLEFKGMHRFIPATARHMGFKVVEMPVHHRPRTAGVPKYGMGILSRGPSGLVDLFAVRYMRSRRRPVDSREVPPAP
jgi:dolichol-phosphate mannosyltransferase